MSHSETIELAVEQFLAHKRALGASTTPRRRSCGCWSATPPTTLRCGWTISRP